MKYYKYTDEKINERGPYRLQPLATTSMDDRPNLRYPLHYRGEEIWPTKQWQWSRERAENALANNELVISNIKGKWTVNYKQYLKNQDGHERGQKLFSIIEGIYTQQGTYDLKDVFPDVKFTFPKPPRLIETLIELFSDPDSIILDSFAGSGTTAHAVLNLNKQDGGNRKFILVEMEDYAETITAERVRRVINGYADKEGTGGSFDYYELGQPLFDENGDLNEAVAIEKIRNYIFYSETKTPLKPAENKDNIYFLNLFNDTAYYFYYEPEGLTSLNHEFLSTIRTKAGQYVIYADNCLLTKDFLTKRNTIFKKIPRDITRF